MSNFIEHLKAKINACGNYEDLVGDGENHTCTNQHLIDSTLDLIDSLGENARRMLEIGRVQDKLVEMGFQLLNKNVYEYSIVFSNRYRLNKINEVEIIFVREYCQINFEVGRYYYTSPTWQQELINKVKELING